MYFILNSKTFAIVLISSNKRFFVWYYDQFGNLPHHFVWTIRVPSGHILVDSPSIRRRNSTWKVRRNDINFEGRIHMEIMTSIRRGNFDVDSTFKIGEISMSSPRGFFSLFWRQIDVTSVLAVSIALFPNIFFAGNLF